MMLAPMRAWLAAFLIIAVSIPARAVDVPDGFAVDVLATELNAATAMAVAPDGRIFIAEQTGLLRVWKDGRLLSSPALDLSARLDTYWERGLIGITLHPDFPHTPHLFVMVVAKEPFPHHVVSRFTVIGDQVDESSEHVLIKGDDQSKIGGTVPWGHQGGPLCFGPDGCLYFGLGEQTAGAPAQSLEALSGKILRLHADGRVPEDNPFFDRTSGKYRAIWALGIRNSFGLAFQPGTGRLFETDVGQTSWEEVNIIVRGGNYGWPEVEGVGGGERFRDPIYSYPPAIGRSICGAAFVPDADPFPAAWRGQFFFVDWAANWLKSLDPDHPESVSTVATGFNGPVSVQPAPDGSLLVLNRGTIWRDNKNWKANTGSLVRLRAAGKSEVIAKAPAWEKTLSATRLFQKVNPIAPREEFVEFSINAEPWRPGLRARRWISIPSGAALHVNGEGEFRFPKGTIVIQQYDLEADGRPWETHVMWMTGERTARAAAYRWSPDARDAALIEDGSIVALPGSPARRSFSPGPETHLNLDATVIGFLLPVSPRQIDRENQIDAWKRRGWLEASFDLERNTPLAALEDKNVSLEHRVRSFLDVNCASCHRPGGPSRGNFDARLVTPLAQQGLLDGKLIAGDLGISGARVILPGDPDRSVLLQRLLRHDQFRMPPISVNDEASPAISIIEAWIRSIPPEPRENCP